MGEERAALTQTMSKADVFGLSFGAMIGWGWVVFASNWIKTAGTAGASVAFLVGALMCAAVSLVYAELTSAMPVAGGPVAFSYRGLGETLSWITGWTMTFSYLSVAAWESVAITAAIDFIIPIPRILPLWTMAGETVYASWAMTGLTLSCLITLLNCRGTRLSATAQTIGTAVLLCVGLFFLVVSGAKGTVANLKPTWTTRSGIASVLMMVPFMMVGFDVVPQSAEEANLPQGSVGRLLMLSVVAATLWYLGMVLGLGYAIPDSIRDSSQLAVCTAVEYLLGAPFWGKVLALGGVFGILTSWNAFVLASSRVLFSMGRAKMLPPGLACVDPTNGVPIRAIQLVGMACAVAPFFGSQILLWLANVGGFCTCVTYVIVSAAFIRLRRTEPDLARPYRAGKTLFVGIASLAISVFFITLYLPVGPSSLRWPHEWAIVALWACTGLVAARLSKRINRDVNPDERRSLLFGKQ